MYKTEVEQYTLNILIFRILLQFFRIFENSSHRLTITYKTALNLN